jgi:hypothetical protein
VSRRLPSLSQRLQAQDLLKAEQRERGAHAAEVGRTQEIAKLSSMTFAAILVERTRQCEDALRLIASEEAEAIGIKGIRMVATLALGGAIELPKSEEKKEGE